MFTKILQELSVLAQTIIQPGTLDRRKGLSATGPRWLVFALTHRPIVPVGASQELWPSCTCRGQTLAHDSVQMGLTPSIWARPVPMNHRGLQPSTLTHQGRWTQHQETPRSGDRSANEGPFVPWVAKLLRSAAMAPTRALGLTHPGGAREVRQSIGGAGTLTSTLKQ